MGMHGNQLENTGSPRLDRAAILLYSVMEFQKSLHVA